MKPHKLCANKKLRMRYFFEWLRKRIRKCVCLVTARSRWAAASCRQFKPAQRSRMMVIFLSKSESRSHVYLFFRLCVFISVSSLLCFSASFLFFFYIFFFATSHSPFYARTNATIVRHNRTSVSAIFATEKLTPGRDSGSLGIYVSR